MSPAICKKNGIYSFASWVPFFKLFRGNDTVKNFHIQSPFASALLCVPAITGAERQVSELDQPSAMQKS
jgi:hypothetical protein